MMQKGKKMSPNIKSVSAKNTSKSGIASSKNLSSFSEDPNAFENKIFNKGFLKDYLVKEKEKKKIISGKKLLKLNKITKRKEKSLPTKHPDADERTIFVGNININTKRRKVEAYFSQYGKVESVRYRGVAPESLNMSKKEAITKKRLHPEQKSLIAYVRFEDKVAKEKALEANGQVFEGLHIRVDSTTIEKYEENSSIFIGNIAWETKDEDVWDFFSGCGKITGVRVVRSSVTGACKGFGFVAFESADSIELARYLDGKYFNGRPVRVKRVSKQDESKKPKRLKKSGVSSLLHEGKDKNKMSSAFMKRDKSQVNNAKEPKRLKRKSLREDSSIPLDSNFRGFRAVEGGHAVKKNKRTRETKGQKQKRLIAQKLAT